MATVTEMEIPNGHAQAPERSGQGTPFFPDLEDASVFITGGGSGIGAALTRAFAAQGAKVGFVSLRREPAERLCEEVACRARHRPLFLPCDIRDVDRLREAVSELRERHGPIGVLVNNAARDTRHRLDSMTVEEWDDSIGTNLRPYFFTSQFVQGDMTALGSGSVINLGSNCANLGLSGYPAYVAAKAAIVGLTRALARELGPGGIRVNALVPGWVLTERQRELWVTEEAISECLAQQCLKTTVGEEDVAYAALFLASSASGMITGQSIIVDGGRA